MEVKLAYERIAFHVDLSERFQRQRAGALLGVRQASREKAKLSRCSSQIAAGPHRQREVGDPRIVWKSSTSSPQKVTAGAPIIVVTLCASSGRLLHALVDFGHVPADTGGGAWAFRASWARAGPTPTLARAAAQGAALVRISVRGAIYAGPSLRTVGVGQARVLRRLALEATEGLNAIAAGLAVLA
jgi:hypothetical protein